MNLVLYVLLMIMTIQIYAEEGSTFSALPDGDSIEDLKSSYQMNSQFRSGMFLIYDCSNKFYACVSSDSNKKCRDMRDKSIKNKQNNYPCAPLKKFKTNESCLAKNHDVIESVAFKRFCFPKS